MNKDVESHVCIGRLHFVEFPASDRKKYGTTVSTVSILKLHDNKKKAKANNEEQDLVAAFILTLYSIDYFSSDIIFYY